MDSGGASVAENAFFEAKIRPVLIEHCYECHSLEAGVAEGGLRVDDRAALRTGGGRGSAVVPTQLDASLLLVALSHTDNDFKMPPDEPRLPDQVLRDFQRWIEMGAPDPRDRQPASRDSQWIGLEGAQSHWSYQPLMASDTPDTSGLGFDEWPRDAIDHYVMARLNENGLTPSRDARAAVLLRRVYFDLIGMPPSPEDIDRFAQASDAGGIDSALAAEVDALLDSAHFGEHWGRHWLDVARFGESSGKDANIPFPYAWRYRDYVIDAINAGVPIDRFLIEQVAGDLLPYTSDDERARLLVATGYLAVGTKNLSEGNDAQFQADLIDEQIDSVTRGVLGSSVACARCHDHKFDPFAMQDYYALAGIFSSSKTFFGTFVSPASRQGGELIPLPELEEQIVLQASVSPARVTELKDQLADLQAERAMMDAAKQAMFAGQTPEKTFTLREVLANIWRTGPIVGKLQTIDDQGRAVPVAMGVLDREHIHDAPLLLRGDINRPDATIPRAFPRAIDLGESPEIPQDQSGRLELARWLTHPQHPLTGRVFVNRVWHHLFGRGLVSTVDDFGTTGDVPSHPLLLDRLALDFTADGWSLKRLVRRLVLSRSYRQASDFREEAFLKSPENRLLWRMPKRRLPAEAIRDAMLVVAGELDASRPQGSLVGRTILDKPISLIGLDKRLPADLDGSKHRSVYLPVIRDRLPDVLDLFDFAEPSLVTGSRATTNVPVQALYLMNSPFVQQRSQALAARLAQAADSRPERVDLAFQLCFGRRPDDVERQRALTFLGSSESGKDGNANELPQVDRELWISFCQALLSTAEFRNID